MSVDLKVELQKELGTAYTVVDAQIMPARNYTMLDTFGGIVSKDGRKKMFRAALGSQFDVKHLVSDVASEVRFAFNKQL